MADDRTSTGVGFPQTTIPPVYHIRSILLSPPKDPTVSPENNHWLFLLLAGWDQKRVVELLSLDSPQRKRSRGAGVEEFAKYAFFVLKGKRRDFERSVLKYVSLKISALTH